MLTLPYVFSSGAMFQQNSVLTITGTAEPKAKVTCEILPSGGAESSWVYAGEDGRFKVNIGTPAASFDSYTIKLTTDTGDEHIMNDVLFGELWMASGQSNMEMPNQAQHKPELMYDRIPSVLTVSSPMNPITWRRESGSMRTNPRPCSMYPRWQPHSAMMYTIFSTKTQMFPWDFSTLHGAELRCMHGFPVKHTKTTNICWIA